ncbi:MAG: ornithine carbamoyltransferase, partial [Planctomycetota bacterium]
MKDFLSITDYSPEKLRELLRTSAKLKNLYSVGGNDLCLTGKVLAMLFEKPSLRTRISFHVAMAELDGGVIYVKPEDIGAELDGGVIYVKPEDIGGIGKREPIKDMARVLSRYVDGIMARTFEHSTITELARFSSVPVINALTDWLHPCQAMADVLTIQEHCEDLKGTRIAFIGDGNNVARSLAFASAKLGMKMVIATPPDYQLDAESIRKANKISPDTVTQTNNPAQAVAKANIVYTDTW